MYTCAGTKIHSQYRLKIVKKKKKKGGGVVKKQKRGVIIYISINGMPKLKIISMCVLLSNCPDHF